MGDDKDCRERHADRDETGAAREASGATTYSGKHREGVAPGSSGQNLTTRSDLPRRDGRQD